MLTRTGQTLSATLAYVNLKSDTKDKMWIMLLVLQKAASKKCPIKQFKAKSLSSCLLYIDNAGLSLEMGALFIYLFLLFFNDVSVAWSNKQTCIAWKWSGTRIELKNETFLKNFRQSGDILFKTTITRRSLESQYNKMAGGSKPYTVCVRVCLLIVSFINRNHRNNNRVLLAKYKTMWITSERM